MNILARIQLAVATLINEHTGPIKTMKEISDYSELLIRKGLFNNKEYNQLSPISQSTLSRTINNKATPEKEEMVLRFLEAILDEFFGIEFSKPRETYIKTRITSQILPPLKKEKETILPGISIFPKLPFSEVKKSFKNAEKVEILQTILPKWPSLDSALKDCEEIKILLLKPYSSMAQQRGNDLNHPQKGIPFNNLIISSVNMVIRSIEQYKLQNRIRLRFYQSAPAISMYKSTDLNGQVTRFVGVYWYKETTINSPIFLLGSPYSNFAENVDLHFNNLWESGLQDVPLDSKKFNNYLKHLKLIHQQTRTIPPTLFEPIYQFYQAFYLENGKETSFFIKLDLTNQAASLRVDKPQDRTYNGLFRINKNSLTVTLEYHGYERVEQWFLQLFLGNIDLNEAHVLKGLFTRCSSNDGLPVCSKIILLKAPPFTKNSKPITNLSPKQKSFIGSPINEWSIH